MKTNIVFDLIQNSIYFVLFCLVKKIFAVSLSHFVSKLGKRCENLKWSWFRGTFLSVLILSYSPLSHCHQREHKKSPCSLKCSIYFTWIQEILYGIRKAQANSTCWGQFLLCFPWRCHFINWEQSPLKLKLCSCHYQNTPWIRGTNNPELLLQGAGASRETNQLLWISESVCSPTELYWI